MPTFFKILTVCSVVCVLTSCEKVIRKTEQVTEKIKTKTKGGIEKQAERVIHKIYPPFDHDKPDTEFQILLV